MLTLDLIPFEDKEVMPFRKSLDLFGILDGASHNVSYSEFINFRGKGFVLESHHYQYFFFLSMTTKYLHFQAQILFL